MELKYSMTRTNKTSLMAETGENDPLRFVFEKKRIRLALLPSIVFVTLVWLAFLLQFSSLLDVHFSRWGILPGETAGLKGILFSPFIHASFSHLWSNTLPLLILVWMLFYFYHKIALRAFVWLWLLSGLMTWFIGRSAYHVGASGLVFAILFFLFFSGILRRYIPLVAVSLVVAFIYGGTVWSIFPIAEKVDDSISWEAHLAGAAAGLLLSLLFRKQGPQKPEKEWSDDFGDEEDVENDAEDVVRSVEDVENDAEDAERSVEDVGGYLERDAGDDENQFF